MKKGGVLGDGDVELPEQIDERDDSGPGMAEERASKRGIREHPEDLRLGDLIEYCKRLKASTAIGLLGSAAGLLLGVAVAGWKAKAWVDAKETADLEKQLAARTPPIESDARSQVDASTSSAPAPPSPAASATMPTTAAAPIASTAPSCRPPKYPPQITERHPYCIEIARGDSPDVSAERVFDLARKAQKELGVYWAGNPPAKANRIMPVNGGAHQLVRVARWYGVSRPVAESVCDFLACRNWNGTDNGVEKVCEILEKCK